MNQLKYYISNLYKNHQNLANVFLLVVLTSIVFYNSLNKYLIEVDDFSVFLHTQRSVTEVFLTNTFGGNSGYNYRPIEVLSHQFDISVYGDDSVFGRHFTNLIFHIFCVILVYLIGYYLTKKKIVGLVSGVLFAVHIIHSNSLPPTAWITGRIDIVVTFFYLITILFFIRFLQKESNLLYIFSFITFFFALLSKEMAVTLPLVILAYVLLSPDTEEENKRIDIKRIGLLFKVVLLVGILAIALGLIFNPGFMERHFSPDNKFKQATIEKIQYLQQVVLISGGILTLGISIILILSKLSKKASNFILSIRYSIPYFLILFFYLIIRFSIIGGLGGGYISESGEVTNLQFGIGPLMRDVFGLTGLIWPIGIYFNIEIFKFQIANPFLFFTVSVLILIAIAFMLYKFIKNKQTIMAFSLLWIFITALPINNILITPWQYNTKYLYLPLVGFCILISSLIDRLVHTKHVYSNLVKGFATVSILLVTVLSSLLIFKHNERIGESGEIMKKLVSDIKNKYQSKISDKTNIFFITYPISTISTASAMFIYPYMQDALNYSDNFKGFGKKYKYSFLLFMSEENEYPISLNWEDESNFTIDGIDINKCLIIPDSLSLLDEQIKRIYKRNPPHAIMQPLPSVGESKETDNSVITVIKFNKESSKAQLRIRLKEAQTNSLENSIFFICEKGHLKLVKEF
jgi:hypothetical protein